MRYRLRGSSSRVDFELDESRSGAKTGRIWYYIDLEKWTMAMASDEDVDEWKGSY